VAVQLLRRDETFGEVVGEVLRFRDQEERTMKRDKSQVGVILAALALALVSPRAMAAEVPGITSDGKVLIGAVGPLSGPVAYGGRAALESLQMYIDSVNEQGGVNGRKIQLIWEDDAYDPGKTVAAVRKLVTVNKVLAVAPIIGTAHIMAVRQYLNTEKVVAFNGKAADPFVGNWPYLFGLGTPYEIQGAIGMDFIVNDLGAKKKGETVYAVVPDDAFGTAETRGPEQVAKEQGVKLVVERVPRGADQFGSVVTNIKRSGAKYVIVGTPRAGTAALMRESEAQGLDVTFMSPNGATTEAAIFDLAGKRYAEHYFGVHSVTQWEDESDPLIKWARERFRTTGKTNALKEKNFFYVWGLIVGKTVVEGVRRCGAEVTRERLRDALASMESFDLGGGVAPVTYKGAKIQIPGTTARVSKGAIVDGVVSLKPATAMRKPSISIELQK
jgi:branched-chain amino acid transport system substrate-binding protein